MMILIMYLYYLIEFFKYYIIYTLGFHIKVKSKKKLCVLGIVGAIVMDIWELHGSNWTIDALYPYILFIILFSAFGFYMKRKRDICIILWTMPTVGFIDEMFYLCNRCLLHMFGMYSDVFSAQLSNLMTLFFLITVLSILNKKTRYGLMKMPVSYLAFFLVVVMVNEIIIGLVEQFITRQNYKYAPTVLLFGLNAFIQMVLILLLASKSEYQKERDLLNMKYMDIQTKYVAMIREEDAQTRRFRHDIRAHMSVISNLCEEGRYKETKKYIDDYYGYINDTYVRINVGNDTVNAILNHYYAIAKEEHISLHIKGHIPTCCEIKPYDLCTIFSNVLQNAIDAVTTCEQKDVKINIRSDERMLYIKEENKFNGERKLENNYLVSTKRNASVHGIGLENIQSVLDNYAGEMDYQIDKNVFVIKIWLRY